MSRRRILLVGHPGQDEYYTPGGRVERGETAHQALGRELKEELGIEMTSAFYVFSRFVPDPLITGSREYGYFVVGWTGKVRPLSEITRVKWTTKADIDSGRVTVMAPIAYEIVPRLSLRDLL